MASDRAIALRRLRAIDRIAAVASRFEQDHRVPAPDLKTFPRADYPTREAMLLERMAAYIEALADAIGVSAGEGPSPEQQAEAALRQVLTGNIGAVSAWVAVQDDPAAISALMRLEASGQGRVTVDRVGTDRLAAIARAAAAPPAPEPAAPAAPGVSDEDRALIRDALGLDVPALLDAIQTEDNPTVLLTLRQFEADGQDRAEVAQAVEARLGTIQGNGAARAAADLITQDQDAILEAVETLADRDVLNIALDTEKEDRGRPEVVEALEGRIMATDQSRGADAATAAATSQSGADGADAEDDEIPPLRIDPAGSIPSV